MKMVAWHASALESLRNAIALATTGTRYELYIRILSNHKF